MEKLIKCLKSKAMLRIAMFATLFVLMDTLIEMNKKTEEQTTYSITLESLVLAQSETDGETGGTTGGGGTDGETGGGTGGQTGGGCTCPNNPGTYYEDYYNAQKNSRRTEIRIDWNTGGSYTVTLEGVLTYCKYHRRRKCYERLNGFVVTQTTRQNN